MLIGELECAGHGNITSTFAPRAFVLEARDQFRHQRQLAILRQQLDQIAYRVGKGIDAGKYLVWVLLLIYVLPLPSGAKRLADYAQADYPPQWSRYYQAGQWLKANTPEDAVVLCRKGYWMYIISGRRCVGFPFAAPAEVLAHMEREHVG